ncbi:MAG TPA: 50S ribosomal protein L3 [Candidatus Binatus sp.]|jgi:large subunit ribosomal protein L3|nr:50S ribosomal protein L3 [Candidatus Binatus sp.]
MPLAGLIGRKLGMTQVYTGAGVLVPVTVIQAGPCTVIATRRTDRNGYSAAQLGFAPAKPQRLPKAVTGQFGKAGTGVFSVLREFRLTDGDPPAVGSEVVVSELFKAGERIDVSGVSKGRGTAGVMKRHRFSGFPGSHGTHEYFRHGGSIGNRSYPGRVFKGKRMSGRYGADRITTRNLEVVAIRPEEHLLLVRGAIPGARGGTVLVRKRPEVRR